MLTTRLKIRIGPVKNNYWHEALAWVGAHTAIHVEEDGEYYVVETSAAVGLNYYRTIGKHTPSASVRKVMETIAHYCNAALTRGEMGCSVDYRRLNEDSYAGHIAQHSELVGQED